MQIDVSQSPSPRRLQATPRSNRRGIALATLLAASLVLALPRTANAQSDAPLTPSTLPGGKLISSEEAKKLIDQKAALVIDTRSPVNFGKSHLPTAVSLAYKENSEKVASFDSSLDQFDLKKLPADKNAGIVIYSDGPTGWKSYKAAVLAVKAGHKNVMYLRGGWTEWTAKGFPAEK